MALQKFAQGIRDSNLGGKALEKNNYYYQIQVKNDYIERYKIMQACGYLEITVILQLGATTWVLIKSQFTDLSQMESIKSA